MKTDFTVPALGESITEADLAKWLVADGTYVEVDQAVCELETDKAAAEVPAPVAGTLHHVAKEGDTVNVGDVLGKIDEASKSETSTGKSSAPKPPARTQEPDAKAINEAPKEPTLSETQSDDIENLSPSVRKLIKDNDIDPSQISPSGPRGRLLKSDVTDYIERQNGEASQTPVEKAVESEPKRSVPAVKSDGGSRLVPMTRLRKTIAKRLVQAQQDAAMLTTFNEIDMKECMNLRSQFKEKFQKLHQVNLGFMSFFAKAVCNGLKEYPSINAYIDGDNIRYHDHVHLGIAVSTERGLVVPVLKYADQMSFAEIEKEIRSLAEAAKLGKLGINDLSGGTFTITNGGVFGSMFSTPILNPPQSGILGMHAIQKRPKVMPDDSIQARPMMYVALSYDHRLVDGKESVSFLVRVKEGIENPSRIMLEV